MTYFIIYSAGVPSRLQVARRATRLKKVRTTGRMEDVQDLLDYCRQDYLALPEPPSAAQGSERALVVLSGAHALVPAAPPPQPSTAMISAGYNKVLTGAYHVPIDMEQYGVEGAAFTGAQQIRWVTQLAQADMQRQFVLHGDGKYKLHCGKWVLLTLGTHVVARDTSNAEKILTSFRPLVYLLCKQQESTDACVYLAEVRELALHARVVCIVIPSIAVHCRRWKRWPRSMPAWACSQGRSSRTIRMAFATHSRRCGQARSLANAGHTSRESFLRASTARRSGPASRRLRGTCSKSTWCVMHM